MAPRHPVYDLLNRQHGRVVSTRRDLLPYGMAGYYGIDMANGYSPISLKHFVEYFAVLQFGTPDAVPHFPIVWNDLLALARPGMLHALDVRWIVSDGQWMVGPSSHSRPRVGETPTGASSAVNGRASR